MEQSSEGSPRRLSQNQLHGLLVQAISGGTYAITPLQSSMHGYSPPVTRPTSYIAFYRTNPYLRCYGLSKEQIDRFLEAFPRLSVEPISPRATLQRSLERLVNNREWRTASGMVGGNLPVVVVACRQTHHGLSAELWYPGGVDPWVLFRIVKGLAKEARRGQ